ncbi:tropomyosin, smooth muscle/fibroblast CTM1-like [Arachis ipaensis]|uniref:tropomyosin, smooth muscle/fibroblast CTM1-like n=1 Tax=Arachis ipaensis TaxID=130454 RepID=UPI0007AF49D0|nr:tropomyosin, smooth muscle/fibroblast CTM1-like [Arachis ipaensis]XP_025678932.1 tropomyosin, smooth muscle/fibroblast CTM1-like [Arachis hypogaea]
MYRTLLRGAVIAQKAEFKLSEMQALRRKLESSGKANNDFKVQVELLQGQLSEVGKKLKAAEEKTESTEEKLKASDETVSHLTEREMTLESQLSAAQGRVAALEKERDQAVSSAKAAKAEVDELKRKHKATKEQGKNAIFMTEEALKAQVKIVAPDFDTSAIGVFKTIQHCKIVDTENELL